MSRRFQTRLRELADQIESSGGSALAIAADVGHVRSASQAAETIAAELGALDVLVNNAGVMPPGEVGSQKLAGALRAIQAFLPAMMEAARSGGVADLINVSSIGKLVFPRCASPTCSQA